MSSYRVSTHETNDWCHLCGERRDSLADVWWPKNAEHEKKRGQKPRLDAAEGRYVRICVSCADEIAMVARRPA